MVQNGAIAVRTKMPFEGRLGALVGPATPGSAVPATHARGGEAAPGRPGTRKAASPLLHPGTAWNLQGRFSSAASREARSCAGQSEAIRSPARDASRELERCRGVPALYEGQEVGRDRDTPWPQPATSISFRPT